MRENYMWPKIELELLENIKNIEKSSRNVIKTI